MLPSRLPYNSITLANLSSVSEWGFLDSLLGATIERTVMDASLLFLDGARPTLKFGLQEIAAKIREVSGPYWLSITAADEDALAWLQANWAFHPLTIEDCRTYNPRPKLEEYAGYIFMVLHKVLLVEGEVQARDLQVFFSKDYLITIQGQALALLPAGEEAAVDLIKGTDYLLYRLLSTLGEGYFDLLGSMDERIEQVEEQVITIPSPLAVQGIFRLRRNLISFLRVAAPFREVLYQLNSRDYPYVEPAHQTYFRDVHSSLVYIYEMIETQRDLISGALEAHMSAVSNNLNEVMKRLTIIATIFLPISFVASAWGMNFEFMPFKQPLAMWATIALIVLLPLGMLIWFRVRRWL